MNYGELKSAVIGESHRPDLSAEAPTFIRRAESMIARNLRAAEMIAHAKLGDDARLEGAVYALPIDFLEARAFWAPSHRGPRWLEQRSLAQIKSMPVHWPVQWYAISGDRVEFRGRPGETVTIEIEYFARPAPLVADADTNALLEHHEELYLAAACFYLYRHTQDLELAQAQLDSFTDAVETLNEQAGRHLGSPTANPVYAFGPGPGGY